MPRYLTLSEIYELIRAAGAQEYYHFARNYKTYKEYLDTSMTLIKAGNNLYITKCGNHYSTFIPGSYTFIKVEEVSENELKV